MVPYATRSPEFVTASGRRSEASILALLGAEGLPPAARIQSLLDNLHACDPTVPGLIDAVERLSGLKFDFRLQSYPVLHDLNLDRRPRTAPTHRISTRSRSCTVGSASRAFSTRMRCDKP